jgi:polyisoprenoid-binding protein YceI
LTKSSSASGAGHVLGSRYASSLISVADSAGALAFVEKDMASLKTGDSPKLDGHLKSADFFDVEKFKEGTFKITKVEAIKGAKAGSPTHNITGDLTIKGKTHPETFAAIVTQEGKGFAATATTEIKDRTQYDIVYNSAKFKAVSALGDKLIQDNIKVELALKTK